MVTKKGEHQNRYGGVFLLTDRGIQAAEHVQSKVQQAVELAGTFQSAVVAASEFPKKVFVVDSLSAAIGEQILVRYALQAVAFFAQ